MYTSRIYMSLLNFQRPVMALNSESDVRQICKNISDLTDRHEELGNSLDSLSMICCGPAGARNPVLKILNSEELLLSILKVNECPEILKKKADLCVEILNSLLLLSSKKEWKIIISLVKVVLESDYQDLKTFVHDIWNKKELYKAPAELVLMLVNHEPVLVEKLLCNLYVTREENKDVWKEYPYQSWICWCSQVSELFCLVTSILNQFLIYVKAKSAMLKIISDFIANVMDECEKSKRYFFSLYPLEYQSFAASLFIEPERNPRKKEIIKKFNSINNANTTLMLMFLSQYPLWMDLINI